MENFIVNKLIIIINFLKVYQHTQGSITSGIYMRTAKKKQTHQSSPNNVLRKALFSLTHGYGITTIHKVKIGLIEFKTTSVLIVIREAICFYFCEFNRRASYPPVQIKMIKLTSSTIRITRKGYVFQW